MRQSLFLEKIEKFLQYLTKGERHVYPISNQTRGITTDSEDTKRKT